MKTYDAIVIGAGIAGLSTARELAKRKKRVLLLERENPGGKASRAAAGILDPYTEAGEETPVFRLGLVAFDFYPSFLDEIGADSRKEIEFEKTGLLYAALTPEDAGILKDRVEWQKRRRVPVESLTAAEVRKLEPVVTERVQGGIFYPQIPKLNAAKLTTALFEAARRAGVEIRTSVESVSLWTQNEKARGVKLSGESLETENVVLATGCWPELHESLGLGIRVKPVRGQILIFRTTSAFRPKTMLHSLRYAYLIPWPDERLLVGSTLESAGFEDGVTPDGQKDILDRASEMAEGIRALPLEKSWTGLRPYVEGGLPRIGPTRIRGLFVAVGYYRGGILIGPLAGKLLAEGIVSGKFSPLLEPFFLST